MNSGAAAALVVALLAGSAVRAAETVEEHVDETYPVGPDATLSIVNTDGNIRIYAADVSEVEMHAVKSAYSAERLREIGIDVKASRTSVVIDTKFPPKLTGWSLADRSGVVEYTLIVPMKTRITRCDLVNGEVLIEGLQGGSAKAHLVNGWLAAHNSFADLDLSLINGKLDVAFDWWTDKNFTLNATSVNGGIRLTAPPDGSADISAETQHGNIGSSFEEDEEPESTGKSVQVSVGAGEGAEIALRSTNGNIRIDKSYEPGSD